jgi:hypothetical protein
MENLQSQRELMKKVTVLFALKVFIAFLEILFLTNVLQGLTAPLAVNFLQNVRLGLTPILKGLQVKKIA